MVVREVFRLLMGFHWFSESGFCDWFLLVLARRVLVISLVLSLSLSLVRACVIEQQVALVMTPRAGTHQVPHFALRFPRLPLSHPFSSCPRPEEPPPPCPHPSLSFHFLPPKGVRLGELHVGFCMGGAVVPARKLQEPQI